MATGGPGAPLYPKDHAHLDPGRVVEHKHLEGVFDLDRGAPAGPRRALADRRVLTGFERNRPAPIAVVPGGLRRGGVTPWARRE